MTLPYMKDNETAIQHIMEYFIKNNILVRKIKRVDITKLMTEEQYQYTLQNTFGKEKFSGAYIETARKDYYLKHDTNPWYNAGKETRHFSGPGLAINKDVYDKIILEFKTDILYCNPPSTCYHYDFSNFENNCYHHVQRFNNEPVVVIPLSLADDIWRI